MTDQPPNHQVGEVINGYQWSGTTWEPIAGVPMSPPPPLPPAKKKAWFKRWWGIGLLAIGAIILVGMFTSGGGDDTATSAPAASETSAAAKAPAEPAGPRIGDKVRDGKFEFTVTKVKDDAKVKDIFGDSVTPKGKFVAVSMTVENIGDEAQFFSASDQLGIDSKGREVKSDGEASYVTSDGGTLFEEINPGNSVDVVVVFDMAENVDLDAIEVHDSFLSDGVTVTLK